MVLLFDEGPKARPFGNIAAAMSGVPDFIIERRIELFREVHPDFGAGVCAALDAMDPRS